MSRANQSADDQSPSLSATRYATRRLHAAEAGSIETAAGYLLEGHPVVFPTDTVYGVGVPAFDGAAIARLYALKGRPMEKGIPVLLADLADLERVCHFLPDAARELMARYWPGPLTVVVPRHPNLPANLSPNDNIAVRIPDSEVGRALIRAAGGALATSSANLSGRPPARSGEEAMAFLGGYVVAVLDGGLSPGELASTVVDCTQPTPVILREGPITAVELFSLRRAAPAKP